MIILYLNMVQASGVAPEFARQHKDKPGAPVRALCEHAHKTMTSGSHCDSHCRAQCFPFDRRECPQSH